LFFFDLLAADPLGPLLTVTIRGPRLTIAAQRQPLGNRPREIGGSDRWGAI
jgi:hypothetical protein